MLTYGTFTALGTVNTVMVDEISALSPAMAIARAQLERSMKSAAGFDRTLSSRA